jgi:1,4-dihydroxy-2-naphthoate octaprenyltransferase
MASAKHWIIASRLRTLPLASASILAGSAMAAQFGNLNLPVTALALLTCFLLQILSNFANDYGDFKNGADSQNRIGPARAVQSGEITPALMLRGIIITAFLALISGIALLIVASDFLKLKPLFFSFFGLGLLSMLAAWKYTAGKNPYGYRGLGDLSVFLFFGILGVSGTFYLITHTWSPIILLPALVIGSLSTAVLTLNNLRDVENDAAAGKRTIIVQLGFEKGKIYFVFLHFIAFISCITLIWLKKEILAFILLLPSFILLPQVLRVWKTQEPGALDKELKITALCTLCFAILMWFVYLL